MALSEYGAVEAQSMNQLSNEAQWQLHSYQNYKRNQEMMEDSYKYQRKLNEQMAQLESSSIERNVAGLRMAGLSPSMASGTMSSAGSGGSVAPLSNDAQYHETKSLGAAAIEAKAIENQTKLTDAQVDLMSAQAEKARTDSGYTNYMLANNYDADKTIQSFCQSYAKRVSENKNASPMEKALADTLASSTASQGTLKGVNTYLETYGFNFQMLADVTVNQLIHKVNSGKIADKEVMQSLIRADYQAFVNMVKTSAEISARTNLLNGQINLLPEEKQKLINEIKLLEQQRKAILHGDLIESMRVDPAATILRETYETSKQLLQMGTNVYAAKKIFGKPPAEPVKREIKEVQRKTEYHPRIYGSDGVTPVNSEQGYMETLKSGRW